MWYSTPEGTLYIHEITKDVVTQVAPEELDLFDDLLVNYPQVDASRNSPEDVLGFGIEGAIIAATPIVAAMTGTVITFLITEVIKVTKEETTEVIRKKIKAILSPENKGAQGLSKDQLEMVKNLAIKRAKDLGADPQQAKSWANALVGSLALK